MTSGVSRFLAAIFLAASLAGCASGPKYTEVTGAIPSIKNGQGRVYFLRSSTFFGGAAQPLIYVNNQAVGRSEPGGFFFVDLPAGPYQAKTTTETVTTLDFTVYRNETKYIRTGASLGLFFPRMEFTIIHESMAERELEELSYTGKPLPTASK
ncbi:DUF2846 domain-containing protein [Herbaspirillum sp. CF444]|uniref:DUF2846 domain-containing protein n=1 Tax=Herbaspirillum sp. CF444 TaxID=1144319 RepID=UPI0009DA6844|nr:DUF2846 domain-containing protein [Herbaspirillum sp. CF444]